MKMKGKGKNKIKGGDSRIPYTKIKSGGKKKLFGGGSYGPADKRNKVKRRK